MLEALHLKYRPQRFDDVIGQNAVVDALDAIVKRDGAHAFLLSGPSGVGKTTLARIAAHELGCEDKDITEVDAATYTGIESMRAIQATLQYRPFGGSKGRSIIIDEAHGLSRQAWDSLLKVVEEPPAHIYWFFCTTNPGRVPTTIKTRCIAFQLKPLREKDLETLLYDVCELEKIKLPGDICTMIIREALGSPRQLLIGLATCAGVTTRKEAAELLKTIAEIDPVHELCRFLSQGKGSWTKVMGLVEEIGDANPESIRIAICNYMASACRNSKNDREATHFLQILDAFSQPYNPAEQSAPLLLSIGRVLFSGPEED